MPPALLQSQLGCLERGSDLLVVPAGGGGEAGGGGGAEAVAVRVARLLGMDGIEAGLGVSVPS